MNSFQRKLFFLILFSHTFYVQSNGAGTISVPIMTGNNFPNVEICEKANIQLKFEHFNFLNDNIFTVEIAANGDFVNGPIISLIGQRGVGGNSINQNIDVSFPPPPNGLLANTNYQVRIKGSSPLTYSSPNLYPFRIAKIGPLPDSAFFPEGYWRGSFFTWKPNIQTIILNANTQDIFNPANYLGYVTKKALSFDLNWGFDVESAPGTLFDSSEVCGSHANFYSIRLRRKINFEAGYYIFGGGGDDGFRLSLDGGATWVIDLWADHEFAGKLYNNGCGVFLDAGPKNVVVDYYERAEHSRIQVIIKRTGDPLANPLQITNPAEGTSVCLQSAPFQMLSNAPGGEDWSGPGVSPSGIFDPQVGGLGFKTITYQTGMAAFGSNCLKTTSVTIQVVAGFTASFTGLDTAYCPSVTLVNLVPQTAGGVFFGLGVNGSNFNPSQLQPGFYTIGYALNASSGCGDDTVRKTVHIRSLPDAGFTNLPDSVCKGSGNLLLEPNTPGGTFFGQGVISQNQQWVPSILLSSNSYQIEYQVSVNGCSNSSEQFVYILDKLKPSITIQEIKSRFCNSDPTFVPVSTPLGTWFLNGNLVTEINPGTLNAGNYELKAVYNPTTNQECIDSASAKVQFAVVANPKPDLGADLEVELGLSLTLDPKIGGLYTWASNQSGYTFENNKVLTFNPVSDMTVTVTAPDPTESCFGSDEVFIHVRPALEIPNLFTPNGDGANPDWRFKGAYPNMRILIYDRWGREIYKGVNQGNLAWDGQGSNKSGMYFYLVEHPTDGRKWTGWLKLSE